MDIPLSQDALIERLEDALQQRDMDGVAQWAPRINWIYQYRRDCGAGEQKSDTHQKNALLGHFLVGNEEATTPTGRKGGKAWRAFVEQALDTMVSHGYRVLDDTYYCEFMTEQPDALPIIARVCHRHGVRGDAGESPLHLAMIGIPFLQGVKGSYCKDADINALDDDGQNAFHWLWQEEGLCGSEDYHKEWVKTAQWLLDQGINVQQRDVQGVSGLEKMCEFIEKSTDLFHARQLNEVFKRAQAQAHADALQDATPHASATRRRPGL